MLSAQAQAVAVQGLPALAKFSGILRRMGLISGLKLLRSEHAWLAAWTQEHQLYQLKIHLDSTSTALQVFQMIPKDDKKRYSEVIGHLKKRFKPIDLDIEELKGMQGPWKDMINNFQSLLQVGIGSSEKPAKSSENYTLTWIQWFHMQFCMIGRK